MFTLGTPAWAGDAAAPPVSVTLTFEGIGPYPNQFSAVNQPYSGVGVTLTYATYTAAENHPFTGGQHALDFATVVTFTTTFPINSVSFDHVDTVTFNFGTTSGTLSSPGTGMVGSGTLLPGASPVTSFTIHGTTFIDNVKFN